MMIDCQICGYCHHEDYNCQTGRREVVGEFKPEWSLLEATQESLREHMALCKKLQDRIAELEGRIDNA